ncbi:MAG: CoA-binding protein [Deltaproteobacteria bacterium]|nr:CoA-binding protein [Deltaproteobacteria bacterium]
MTRSIAENPLYAIANPRSVAFLGASNKQTTMGTIQFMSMKELGYEGPVYPIHPSEKEVLGYRAYRSVADLPEVPDLAIIVLPTPIVSRSIEECGRKGIKRAVIISGGFKEVGEEGARLEEELRRIADAYGIRFVGPNCLGVVNPHHKFNPTPLPYEGAPGFIGMASQSGSFVTQMFDYLRPMGLGFSTAFSVGNEANIDIVDCMEYFGMCDKTKVIALYIEGIRRGEAFMEAARSIVPQKPIVALYVGGTETGRKAGFSHTGALAGPDELYEGIFRQSGVIRAASIIELFDFCWILGSLPAPKGRGVVIETHSGGPGANAADAAGRAGLELPALSEKTREKLRSSFPPTASISNPVDMTFSRNHQDLFTIIPQAILEDENADILLMYFLAQGRMMMRQMKAMGFSEEEAARTISQMIETQAESLIHLMKASGKPVVGYSYRFTDDPLQQRLIAAGIPVFPGPERAVAAIRALAAYHETKNLRN